MEPNPYRQWHYESGGERNGPVSERELLELLAKEEVTSATLIWTEGMGDWASLGDTLTHEQDVADEGDPAELQVDCAYSGEKHPQSRMLPFGEEWVYPDYREAFVQQLSEGRSVEEGVIEGAPFEPSFTLSSLILQTWKVWMAQWKEISLAILIIWVPLYIVSELVSYELLDDYSDEWEAFGRSVRIERALELWIGSIITGGIFAMSLSRWKGGGTWALGDLFRSGGEYYGKLLGTRLLYSLVAIGVLLVIVVPIVVIPVEWIQIPLGVAGGFFAIYALTRTSLKDAMPVLMDRGGWEPIVRSWKATKGYFWRLTGYRIVVYGMVLIAAIFMGASFLIPGADHFVVSGILSALIDVLTAGSVVFELVLAAHLNERILQTQNQEPAITDSPIDT